MSFFPPLREPDPELPRPRHYPVWPGQQPQNWLPGALGWSVELARTQDTAVWLTDAFAYPQGMTFTVRTLQRPGTEADEPRHWRQQQSPGTALRVGVMAADGRRALAEDERLPSPESAAQDPSALHLSPHEGGGDSLSFRQVYWLWPLPPAGPLRIYCEWRDRGVPETGVELDAGEAVAAASRAVELWPMPQPPEGEESGGGWWMYGGR